MRTMQKVKLLLLAKSDLIYVKAVGDTMSPRGKISIASRRARTLGSSNLHDIDADQCTNESLSRDWIKLLRE
jgi:hypothetical protein